LGQAGVLGVDEHDLAVRADAELVDVEVADGLRVARHVALVVLAVDHLVRAQHVLEAPQLVQPAQVDPLGVADHAHRALEDALEERDPALLVAADQVYAAALVGGDRQRHAVAGQPGRQPARAALVHPHRRLAGLRVGTARAGSGCRVGRRRCRVAGLGTAGDGLCGCLHGLLQLHARLPAVTDDQLPAGVAVEGATIGPVQATGEGEPAELGADTGLDQRTGAVDAGRTAEQRVAIHHVAALAVFLADHADRAVRRPDGSVAGGEAAAQAQAHAE